MAGKFPVTDERATSPKVKAGGLVMTIALVVVGAMVGAIGPEHFEALGIWGPVAYAGVVAAAGALTFYLKRDPARRNARRLPTTVEPPPSDQLG